MGQMVAENTLSDSATTALTIPLPFFRFFICAMFRPRATHSA